MYWLFFSDWFLEAKKLNFLCGLFFTVLRNVLKKKLGIFLSFKIWTFWNSEISNFFLENVWFSNWNFQVLYRTFQRLIITFLSSFFFVGNIQHFQTQKYLFFSRTFLRLSWNFLSCFLKMFYFWSSEMFSFACFPRKIVLFFGGNALFFLVCFSIYNDPNTPSHILLLLRSCHIIFFSWINYCSNCLAILMYSFLFSFLRLVLAFGGLI